MPAHRGRVLVTFTPGSTAALGAAAADDLEVVAVELEPIRN
jgi:hypothetical protein